MARRVLLGAVRCGYAFLCELRAAIHLDFWVGDTAPQK